MALRWCLQGRSSIAQIAAKRMPTTTEQDRSPPNLNFEKIVIPHQLDSNSRSQSNSGSDGTIGRGTGGGKRVRINQWSLGPHVLASTRTSLATRLLSRLVESCQDPGFGLAMRRRCVVRLPWKHSRLRFVNFFIDRAHDIDEGLGCGRRGTAAQC